MIFLFGLFITNFWLIQAASDYGCAKGVPGYKDHCYYGVSGENDFNNAVKGCNMLNGNLAAIGSKEEEAVVLDAAKKADIKNNKFFIGGYQAHGKNGWFDGKSYEYDLKARDGDKYELLDPSDKASVVCALPKYKLCPDGASYYQETNKCYLVHNNSIEQPEALRVCRATGGDVVSIHSKEENGFVGGLLDKNHRVWIGYQAYGSDNNIQGNWSDGSPIDYTEPLGKYAPKRRSGSLASKPDTCFYIIQREKNLDWTQEGCNSDIVKGFVCKSDAFEPKAQGACEQRQEVMQKPCEDGYVPAIVAINEILPKTTKCYLYVKEEKNWDNAKKHCESLGGIRSFRKF